MRSGATSSRTALRRLGLPALLVLLVALVIAVITVSGDDTPTASGDDALQGTADDNDAAAGADDGIAGVGDGGSATVDPDAPIRTATPESPLYDARPEEIPLEVELSQASGLADGDAISIRVVPEGDATEVYGFTAFLCRGDVDITVDAQARPTTFGWCASQPLSPGTNSLLEVAAEPPYEVAEGEFRVGVGSDTFTTRDGKQATVTCGPDDPCQLVLKLQFPNGYGLRSFPLTFR